MDAGKIKGISSALRDALSSSRASPAQAVARAADGHEAAHPGKNGVLVDLGHSARSAGKATEHAAEAANRGVPLEAPTRAPAAGRDMELLSRALRAAHSGMPGPAAQALVRGDDRTVQGFDVPEGAPEDAISNPAIVPARPQGAGGNNAAPLAPPAIAADAGIRAEAHAAQLAAMMPGAAAAGVAQAEPLKPAPVSQRPAPELVTPFLVRQQPSDPPTPYLNQLIVGVALLGLIILILF